MTITPTYDGTGTPTMTATAIPTEPTPEPLQHAWYFYDGDGNMVKGIVNNTVTFYPGRHFNKEVKNQESKIQKFYFAIGQTIAIRTIVNSQDELKWVLSDHLGSASTTANQDGSWNSTIQYTAFGEIRLTKGITPTKYRYTGQLAQAELGLDYYVARFYDPLTGHFTQADTIVPEPGKAQGFDRYSYVNNNSVKYIDPSGHCNLSSSLISSNTINSISNYISCAEDIVEAIDSHQNGNNDIGNLYLKATGIDDLVVAQAQEMHQLNSDTSKVFSDAPIEQRILPSIRVGIFSVGTAANIIGAVQIARAVAAFTRAGTGGSDYYEPGSVRDATYGPGDSLYRVYGGESIQAGHWAYTTNPGNQISAIRGGALPPGNSVTFITKITFNNRIIAETSKVSKLFSQPGGLTQVYLPSSPNVIYNSPKNLPVGLMPFVPIQRINNIINRIDKLWQR